jgi:hypothetical protein
MGLNEELTAAEQRVLQIVGDRARPPVPWNRVQTGYSLTEPPPTGYGFDASALNNIFGAINGYLKTLPWPDLMSKAEFDAQKKVSDLLSAVFGHIHYY